MNNIVKASFVRGVRTFFQTLGTTIPVGTVVTPVMIQELGWNILLVIGAWLGTALLNGFAAFATGMVTGLPEADYEAYLHMDVEEPDDAEVYEDDDE